MDRNEKQKECFLQWKANNCKGTLVAATGFGKTRVALNSIKAFRMKNPDFKVIIIVPTLPLKDQWIEELSFNKILTGSKVMVVDSALMYNYKCDLLILDECHSYASDENINIFTKIKYKYVLGLTATFERIDGKHKLLEKYIPIFIEIPLRECLRNGWISDYIEYKVNIKVDITEYLEWKRSLLNSLSFFNNDLYLALAMVDPKQIGKKIKFLRETGYTEKEVMIPAMNVTRMLSKTNTFVMEHPIKAEIANKILEHRKGSKCITFSQRTAMAKQIKYGELIHNKLSKKKRKEITDKFTNMTHGVINSVKVLDEGKDFPGVNLGLILCNSSAKRQKVQRIGRGVRLEKNSVTKKTEIFSLVLVGTSEENWFKSSNTGKKYIEITEEELDLVLGNEHEIVADNQYKLLFIE